MEERQSWNGWEIKNLMVYFISTGISLLGSTAYTFAMGLHVLEITGSGLGFSLVLANGIVTAIIMNPLAGILADRGDRKRLVVVSDAANGIVMALLLFLMYQDKQNILWIHLATVAVNAFATMHGIALESIKPDLVTEDRLNAINSYGKVIESTATIIGPLAAGMSFAIIGIEGLVMANGISFFISAFIQNGMIIRSVDWPANRNASNPDASNPDASSGFLTDLKDAVIHIRVNPWIYRYLSVFVIINFGLAFSMNVPLPYFVNRIAMLSASDFGVIQSGFPIGMVIGALSVGLLMKRQPMDRILALAIAGLSVSMSIMAYVMIVHVAMSPLMLFVSLISVMMICGVAIAWLDIPIFIKMQKTLDRDYRGRVMGLGITAAKVVSPLALIMSGALIDKIGIQWLVMAGVCIMATSLLLVLEADDDR